MIAIIGCGNTNRRDDGVGPEIINRLRPKCVGAPEDRLRLFDAGTDGMAVIFAARGCKALIIVDACRSGAEPGAIFTLPGTGAAQPHHRSISLHDFRWDNALYSGRKIYGSNFPGDVTVFLIEAESTDFGIGLSPPVAAAADIAVQSILAMLEERRAIARAAPC